MIVGMSVLPKKLYLGWSPSTSNPCPWNYFDVPHLMVNALHFWNRRKGLDKVSKLLGFAGEIFCDSGGYQVLMRSNPITVKRVIDIQSQLGASLNAALDNGLNPAQHLKNFKAYVVYAQDNPRFNFVP